jgi:hypothetical protein
MRLLVRVRLCGICPCRRCAIVCMYIVLSMALWSVATVGQRDSLLLNCIQVLLLEVNQARHFFDQSFACAAAD